MKKIIRYGTVFAMMLWLLEAQVMATADYLNDLLEQELSLSQQNLMQIKENIEEEKHHSDGTSRSLEVDNNEIASYDLEEAKRIYSIDSTMITDYQNMGKLKNMISDESYIDIPMTTVDGESGSIHVESTDGFNLYGWESHVENTNILFESNQTILEKVKNSIIDSGETVTEVKFVHAAMYQSNFVYIETTSGKEYIIPYFSAIEEYPFENGQVYECSDFIGKLGQVVDEEAMTEEGVFSGVVFKESKTMVPYVIAAGFCVIPIYGIYLVKKRKNYETNNQLQNKK